MGLVPHFFFWSSFKQQIPQRGGFLIDAVYIELFPQSIKQFPCMGVVRSVERLGIINLGFINKFFIQLLHWFRFVAMGFHINNSLYGWQGIPIVQENLLDV